MGIGKGIYKGILKWQFCHGGLHVTADESNRNPDINVRRHNKKKFHAFNF